MVSALLLLDLTQVFCFVVFLVLHENFLTANLRAFFHMFRDYFLVVFSPSPHPQTVEHLCRSSDRQ